MINILKTLGIVLIIFLHWANAVYGGDSTSLTITCAIPAIPGVNAPLIEEVTPKATTEPTAPQKIEPQKEEAPLLLVQDDTTQTVMVKTIYSR